MEGRITRSNIAEHLFQHQLSLVGKTMLDVLDDDKWRFNFTMTHKQLEEFRKYAIPLLQKTFKFNKAKAESTFQFFRVQFGLRIKD